MQNEENDLRARTKKYARRIIRLFAALPKGSASQILGKQVLRSGTSVGANYREACRARSKAEFIAKIGDCLREVDETGYWLELLVDEEFVSKSKMEGLLDETEQLTAIFVTVLKNAKGR